MNAVNYYETPTKAPDHDMVCTLLHYHDETGRLFWNEDRGRGKAETPAGCATFQMRHKGTVEPYPKPKLVFCGKQYAYHRMVLYRTEKIWPEPGTIDHIDHNPLNNRLDNLRIIPRRSHLGASVDRGREIKIDYSEFGSRDLPRACFEQLVAEGHLDYIPKDFIYSNRYIYQNRLLYNPETPYEFKIRGVKKI